MITSNRGSAQPAVVKQPCFHSIFNNSNVIQYGECVSSTQETFGIRSNSDGKKIFAVEFNDNSNRKSSDDDDNDDDNGVEDERDLVGNNIVVDNVDGILIQRKNAEINESDSAATHRNPVVLKRIAWLV